MWYEENWFAYLLLILGVLYLFVFPMPDYIAYTPDAMVGLNLAPQSRNIFAVVLIVAGAYILNRKSQWVKLPF